MNLLQRLFGKKKVKTQLTKEGVTSKMKTFRHVRRYYSDSKWYDEYERKKSEYDDSSSSSGYDSGSSSSSD